jgi:hypothetical protein
MTARWLGIVVGAMLIAVPTTDAQTSAQAGRWRMPRTPDGRQETVIGWTGCQGAVVRDDRAGWNSCGANADR